MLVPKAGPNISGKRVRMSILLPWLTAASSRVRHSLQIHSVGLWSKKAQPIVAAVRGKRCCRGLRCRRGSFLLLGFGWGGLGLAGPGKAKLLVLQSVLFQQRRHGPRRDRAGVEPVLAAVELYDKLLNLVLLSGVVIAEFLDHPAIPRRARINRVQAVKRMVFPAHPSKSNLH